MPDVVPAVADDRAGSAGLVASLLAVLVHATALPPHLLAMVRTASDAAISPCLTLLFTAELRKKS